MYYLQSRYYDPEVGRFLNADAYTSTGQGILGNNMFAYCQNCPVFYTDPNGNRVVGVGVQGELSIGDISIGVEFVIYFDPEVCKDADFLIVAYTYSGYELSASQLDAIAGLLDLATIALFIDSMYAVSNEEDFLEYYLGSAFLQYISSLFSDGGSATFGAFIIDGYENFDDPSDYSGRFDTVTASASVGTHTGGVFVASATKCRSLGLKYGRKYSSTNTLLCPIAFGVSWSVSYYSAPYLIFEGHL